MEEDNGMRKPQLWLAALLLATTAFTGAAAALANPVPFTWNPDGASPALGGSTFTADTISITGYVRDVTQPDGTHLANRIEVITGFSLNGSPVTPTGFGSNYGLYFEFHRSGHRWPATTYPQLHIPRHDAEGGSGKPQRHGILDRQRYRFHEHRTDRRDG
jgi:hypothetical protein